MFELISTKIKILPQRFARTHPIHEGYLYENHKRMYDDEKTVNAKIT